MFSLGEIPPSRNHKIILTLFHFGAGVFLGLFPALTGFCCITIAPGVNYWEIIGILLSIFCLPLGFLFVILGLIGRGRIILGIFRILGRHISS
jgi:hypothetical protein